MFPRVRMRAAELPSHPERGIRLNTTSNRFALILPERQTCPGGWYAVGYISRALLVFMCTFGFALFICDALALGNGFTLVMTLFGISALFTLVFSVMGLGRITFAAGCGLIAVIGAATALMTERAAEKAYYLALALPNAFFRRLDSLGYPGMSERVISYEYPLRRLGMPENECVFVAFAVLLFILCAVFSVCMLKRLRLIPLAVIGGSVCTICLYYGMCTKNVGFGFIIASLCGCAALAGYDHIYTRPKTIGAAVDAELPEDATISEWKEEKRRVLRQNSGLGGFTGLAAALTALVLLIVPMTFKNSMKDIPSLSTPLLKLENYLYSLARGDSPDFSSLIFSGVSALDKRTTASSDRVYTGTRLFEVQVDTSLPVYLRGWVGTDYYGDSWHSLDYDRIAEYKRLFGTDFSPDEMTGDMLRAVDPSLTTVGSAGYRPHTDLGYVTARVSVKKLKPTANVVFMPSYRLGKNQLFAFGSFDEGDVEYSNYSDGIFLSTSYLFSDDYSVVSDIPLLRDPEFAGNIGSFVQNYRRESRIISTISAYGNDSADGLRRAYLVTVHDVVISGKGTLVWRDGSLDIDLRSGSDAPQKDQILAAAVLRLDKMTDELISEDEKDNLSYRYAFVMDEEERRDIRALISVVAKYREYAYQNYLTGCENYTAIKQLASDVVYGPTTVDKNRVYVDTRRYGDMDEYTARHMMVMAVIDYLSENMVYTLSPVDPSPTRDYVNAADTFLFDTQEGYCVQFATSAVMMIRSLGIPARYAEGYIASDFSRNSGGDAVGKYSSLVLDNNAHAWVEVYYDDYGWVQYEATTPYYSEMYEGLVPTVDEVETDVVPDDTTQVTDVVTDSETTMPEDTTAPDDEIVEPEKPVRIPPVLIAVMVVVLVIVICIVALRTRAARVRAGREELSRRAREARDSAGRTAAAKELDDRIMRLLSRLGYRPEPGEQIGAFAARVDEALGMKADSGFTAAADAVLAAEFSGDVPAKGLASIDAFYRELCDYALRGAKPYKRLWLECTLLA